MFPDGGRFGVHLGRDLMAVTAGRSGSALVGRAAETAALTRLWGAALEGRGGTVLLRGEAGIGKSELARQVAITARAAGAMCLWGAGAEEGGAPAYWVWRQVLRTLVHRLDPRAVAEGVGADSAVLSALVPDLCPPGRPASEFALQEAVCGVLARCAERTPVIVVLDDLHVADPPTVRLATAVARGVRHARVLVVATVRPAEADIDAALGTAVEALAAAADTLELGGLTADEVAELVVGVGGPPPSPGLIERILARTDGNPLFVREVAQLLAVEPARADEQWPVPVSIRHALRRRLARVESDVERALVEVGAVIGREFDLATVRAVSGHHWEQLALALDRAATAQLLEPAAPPGHRVRFRHALVRDTVYDDIPLARRARRHAALAEVLAAQLDEADPTRSAVLAHHQLRAVPLVDVDTAAASAERAGREAARAAVHETAAIQFEAAVRVLDQRVPADLLRRCELLLQLGEARTRGGDPAGGRRALGQAAVLARRLGDDEAFARAALHSADRLDFNDVDQPVVPLLREAADRLAGTDSPTRARVLARLAVATYHADPEAAVRTSEAAVTVARRAGDPAALGHVLSGWIYAVWGRHDPPTVLAVADEIVAIGRASADPGTADPETEVEGRLWRVVFLLETGAVGAAEREVHAVARLAERLRQPLHRLLASSRAATLSTLQGRFADALAQAREARQIGRRGGEPDADAVFWAQVFSIWWLEPDAVDESDLAEMERIVRHLTAGSPVSHAPGLILVCRDAGGATRRGRVTPRSAGRASTRSPRTWCGRGTCACSPRHASPSTTPSSPRSSPRPCSPRPSGSRSRPAPWPAPAP